MWLDTLTWLSEGLSNAFVFYRIAEDSGLNVWMNNLSQIVPKETK